MDEVKSRIRSSINFEKMGHQVGELMIPWSDNTVPLGYHPIPVINIKNGNGKKLLVIGGNHGDEFEGPSAIMRVSQEISANDINGQILLIPGLSFDAITQSRRTNPLDDKNMNRAFPGNPNGSPTEMLAAYLENDLMQNFDAIIDFHSGGKASVFMPCSLVYKSENDKLFQKNLALAKAFGITNIWVLGENNDNRSLNSAAGRAHIPMIATELGGGGGVNPKMTNMAELGIFNILNHLKIYKGRNAEAGSRFEAIEIGDPSASIHSPAFGLFDRIVKAGDSISRGQTAGWFHYIAEPERASLKLTFKNNGIILAHSNRGIVKKGEMLALVANKVAIGE